jgi:hypothetical protein
MNNLNSLALKVIWSSGKKLHGRCTIGGEVNLHGTIHEIQSKKFDGVIIKNN